MSETILSCENVYYFYPGRKNSVALTDVSLKIQSGEFISIIGPNGSGKSTLMKCIGGITPPSNGRIYYRDVLVSSLSGEEAAKYRNKTIGFVFQDLELIDVLTVKENLEVPLIIAGETSEQRVAEVAKLLGINHLLKLRVSELSGGEKQRVAIGVGLINDPEIILADEPTANLDKEGRELVVNLLKSYTQKGKTVIIVTHDPYVADHASRTIHLDKGYLR